jgi:hypothetical protein
MKYFKLISIVLWLFGYCGAINGQNYIPVSGGNASGSGGTMSYTFGQVAYLTKPGTTGNVAEGVQQPFEISVITGFEDTRILLELSVYPNPASDFIILKIETDDFVNLNFRLFGINGNLIQSRKPDGDQTQIQMAGLKSGIYFLRISENNNELKTFKIIKE